MEVGGDPAGHGGTRAGAQVVAWGGSGARLRYSWRWVRLGLGSGIWDLGWGLSMRAREMLPGLGSGDLGVGNILCLGRLGAGVPCCATPWRRWVLPP